MNGIFVSSASSFLATVSMYFMVTLVDAANRLSEEKRETDEKGIVSSQVNEHFSPEEITQKY